MIMMQLQTNVLRHLMWTKMAGILLLWTNLDPSSATGIDCSSYSTKSSCAWTSEWNCPGQTPGSSGSASADDSLGYECCCNQNLWKICHDSWQDHGGDDSPWAACLDWSQNSDWGALTDGATLEQNCSIGTWGSIECAGTCQTCERRDCFNTCTGTCQTCQAWDNLALGKTATASSVETGDVQFAASQAVDGDMSTRWSSEYSDPQWLQVDLGSSSVLSSISIKWGGSAAASYDLEGSMDGTDWTTLISGVVGSAGWVTSSLPVNTFARFVKIHGSARTTVWGYSLFELQVMGGTTTTTTTTTEELHASWVAETPSKRRRLQVQLSAPKEEKQEKRPSAKAKAAAKTTRGLN
eukprot:TRINITY_DN10374_c3_g1_i10.p1 TRINITY_DN10374_c3_g1~~TRINITY_DN10374_c3_g1_i10.p1  ORF type:complete len:352 (+),score=43.24 TRINITY_DN10374_c3_g1_i10:78-1133(+)